MADVAVLLECLKRGDGEAVAAAVTARPEIVRARDGQGVLSLLRLVLAGLQVKPHPAPPVTA